MGCLAIMRLSVLETLRRKEFYVVLGLVFVLAIWMQCLNPAASGAARFAKDIVMQVVWLASFALTVPLAARQVVSDLEHKTVYIIMARAIHRWQYVLGRCMGAAAASVVCFTSLFVLLITMSILKGSANLGDWSIWQAYFLQVAALIMLCSIAIFFSTVSSPAGAVTFSFLLVMVMRYGGPAILSKIEAMSGTARGVAWAGYIAMPHFEFFNMAQRVVHNWGPLPTELFLQILAYGLGYSIFMSAFAAYVFRRRWL